MPSKTDVNDNGINDLMEGYIPSEWTVPPYSSPIEYGQPIGPEPNIDEEYIYEDPYAHEVDWATNHGVEYDNANQDLNDWLSLPAPSYQDPFYPPPSLSNQVTPDEFFGPDYFFPDDVYEKAMDDYEFGPDYFFPDEVYQNIFDPTAGPVGGAAQPATSPLNPLLMKAGTYNF